MAAGNDSDAVDGELAAKELERRRKLRALLAQMTADAEELGL